MGSTRRWKARSAIWYVVCGLLGALFVLPLILLILMSVKSPAEAVASPPSLLPSQITITNFIDFYAGVGLGSIINSILVAIATVVGTVVVSTLAAYGFERCRFPGSDALFLVLIATLMIPFQSILTPLFELLHVIHLVNSLVGLALVYITFQLPFALFVMRNAIASVPKELEEAAAVDGASILGILIRVVIPLARPGIITVGLFAFFASWNEFMAALILMTDQSNFTLPVTLNTVVTGSFGVINWGLLEAGVVVAMLPCAVIFILLQRYYFKGMMSGAFK